MSMAFSGKPMGEMNTTPLIDVLLVLLIMFIITIPAATNSVDIDMPGDCGGCPIPSLEPNLNKLTLTAGDRLAWNGTQIEAQQLPTLLRATTKLAVEPELQFEPEPLASYDAASHTLATIKSSGVSRFGFIGNERYRTFGGEE
ncbi:ExbD/TolR family protein [Qipengyuania marisflavi]|uniref:Biopolymer transporter ExbD n=1 Tax=Qipengyuania marisflavi TaxID=2486356 RepID=A0A5S3P5B4_9SPHN|nr:biopolymer transporter ExbD [Qipengyuania marisflavi]TMM48106.1 biopolymer transporter ExbD [Qipengyuania marisflavi]